MFESDGGLQSRRNREHRSSSGPSLMKAFRSSGGRRARIFSSRCRLRFSRAGLVNEPRVQGVDRRVVFSSFFCWFRMVSHAEQRRDLAAESL